MNVKMLGLAVAAVMALVAFPGSTASGTTLEVAGVPQNKSVTIGGGATEGIVLAKTDGSQANTCSESSLHGETVTPFSGSRVTLKLTSLSFKKCTSEAVVVDSAGGFWIEWESGTSASVYSENAEITYPTAFGFSVTCKTGESTKVGTLHGVAAAHAVLTWSVVLNCGFLLPSATWKGTYKMSTPTGLGVVS